DVRAALCAEDGARGAGPGPQPDPARADSAGLQGRRTAQAAASPGERIDRAFRLSRVAALRLLCQKRFDGGSHGIWLLHTGVVSGAGNRDQARPGDGFMDALRLHRLSRYVLVADKNERREANAPKLLIDRLALNHTSQRSQDALLVVSRHALLP